MKKKRLGIYLDTEGIAFAETEGRDLVSSTFLSFSSLEEETSQELTSKIRIEALLQRGLRGLKTELRHAYMGMSEKDIIFRLLEIPFMRKKELELALPLEIEKYIPFKIEDISWDYKERRFFKEKKIKVAFTGVKKSLVKELSEIFADVGIEIDSIESPSFSIIGLLMSLNKISRKNKDFGVFSISEKDGQINIFSNGFPYFSRYTKFSLDAEGRPNVTRVVDELRITLDYYHREANRKSLEKLFLLGKEENLKLFPSVLEELEIPTELISFEGIVKDRKMATFQELNAFSLALRDFRPSFLAFNFLKEKKEAPVEISIPSEIEKVPWNFKPLALLLVIGFLLFGGILFMETRKETAIIIELNKAEEKFNRFPFIKSPHLSSLEALRDKDNKLGELWAKVKESLNIPKDTTSFLNLVAESISQGMWFESIDFKRKPDFKNIDLSVRGYIYLGDAQKERESLNEFIASLKTSDLIKDKGLKVVLNSIEQKNLRDYKVTYFEVKVK